MPQKKRVPTYVASIKDSLYRRKKGNDVIGDTCRFIMHGFFLAY